MASPAAAAARASSMRPMWASAEPRWKCAIANLLLRLTLCRNHDDGLLVAAERIPREADKRKPGESKGIKRTEPQGFSNVSLGLLASAKMQRVQPHPTVGEGEIGIELERVLAFGHRNFRAVGHAEDEAIDGVSQSVIGSD